MRTIWNKNVKKFSKLDENLMCDTLIIGGGIGGLWCAYKLIKSGQKVCIVEANTIGSGVTAGSSAILTFAQELLYDTLIKKHGEDVARRYLQDSISAIENIVEVIEKEKINCSLTPTNFMLVSTKNCGAKKLEKEKLALEKLGASVADIADSGLPFKTKKALLVNGSYVIDPLMLLSGLANYVIKNGWKIYENTHVSSQPNGKFIEINGYKIKAKHFVIATHYPYINFPGFYFFKLHQDQNYSIVFKPNGRQKKFAVDKTYECIDKKGFEYRRVGDNVLCLGPDIRTGVKPYKSKYQVVESHLKKYFGGYKEITRFSAQDCMTADGLPYAGFYSDFLDNVYTLTGFNKWGMTNSYITSDVVCNMILNKECKSGQTMTNASSNQNKKNQVYDKNGSVSEKSQSVIEKNKSTSQKINGQVNMCACDQCHNSNKKIIAEKCNCENQIEKLNDNDVLAMSTNRNIYAPDRNNFFASIITTMQNVAVDIAGWANNILNLDAKKITRIKKNQGAIVKLNGKRLGVYKDDNDELHVIYATCPHLGCSLKWNKDESSYDCPCHGSRFDIDGNILNNPAIKNAKKMNEEINNDN